MYQALNIWVEKEYLFVSKSIEIMRMERNIEDCCSNRKIVVQ